MPPTAGAEGATAPETLRRKDRARVGTLESGRRRNLRRLTEGVSPRRIFRCERRISQVRRQRGLKREEEPLVGGASSYLSPRRPDRP
jgi:hypothetical protein